ncbi:MAG: OmpH family outer membrane protein [Thiomicrospira sp.]|uniref:OmpH family outer membrane protein n=1 Tax=Thiomicrospira sp. TaxID=935 RepID=UPI0019E14E46|nr:OmpH family outer membrane protein [Thiomicrospira sp.]MBE0493234.1 OmpH family outer membrane protein [Thiomicrospira sp.]
MLYFAKKLLVLAFAFLASTAMVQANESIKVGVVNVGLLLEQSPQAKAASSNLEREFAPQQEELAKLNSQLEKEKNDLKRNSLAMSEAQQGAKEREIQMLTREIQRKRNDVQELLNIRRNEELAKLQSLVNSAIREVGTSQSYDLILYEGIAYTNKRIDLTPAVLDYLSKDFEKQGSNFNR